MSLYAIGDTHLPFGAKKPMDIFGGRWENYTEKLESNFSLLLTGDICVICGDISWAMTLEDSAEDFLFLNRLPGQKLIIKGNHDYWFSTATKAKRFLHELGISDIDFLHNTFFPYGENAAICGTRGWFFDEDGGAAHAQKMLARECARLESSLKLAQNRDKYVFLHYPPYFAGRGCTEILDILEKYGVIACYYGHIHSEGLAHIFEGMLRGTRHICVSADYVRFNPVRVL